MSTQAERSPSRKEISKKLEICVRVIMFIAQHKDSEIHTILKKSLQKNQIDDFCGKIALAYHHAPDDDILCLVSMVDKELKKISQSMGIDCPHEPNEQEMLSFLSGQKLLLERNLAILHSAIFYLNLLFSSL